MKQPKQTVNKVFSPHHQRVLSVAVSIILQFSLYALVLFRFSRYFVYFYWSCFAISLLVALFISTRKTKLAYKVAWIVPILLLPVIGGMTYLMFGGARRPHYHREETRKTFQRELPATLSTTDLMRYGPDALQQAWYLGNTALCPAYTNTETAYFPSGKEFLQDYLAELEKAQREYDLNKAAELKYGKLPQLQKELEEEEKVAAAKKEDSLLRDRVTDEEIARIVARWTGIPVEKLVEGEREKLLHLDDVLHQRVIGQDEAVTKVSEAILRSRAGIANPNRPIGSFLFLGPTGVGKTELAKALAQALFDDERNMVRIDMTEYMEKFSVSRLIGAPPGYVGYEEGGQLTEAVRRKPYSVVLFDEVEKAHPDVFNILLQVLDDGRITDSQGRTVDFKNTVIILTSNLGSDIILNDLEQRRAQGSNELSDEARKQIDLLLKSKFRPEFLNRLDEIVYYKSLTKDEMRKIVDLQLNDLRKRMDEGKHLKLEVTTAAKDFIIDSAYDSVYGARPIKRFIQSRVETLIAKAIIQGSYAEGNTLTVDYDGSALVLR